MKLETRADRKKRLYKLIVAFKDLVEARHACSLFSKTIRSTADDLYHPLLNSIVVSYCKPFVENKALGPLSSHWRKFNKPELQQTHDRLLKFRHDNIVHNDLTTVQVQIVPPGVTIGNQVKEIHGVSYTVSQHVLEPESFRLIWDTIEDLRVRLMKAIDEEMLILYGLSQLPNTSFALTFDEGL